MVTDSSLTSVIPQVSPSEKTSTTASKSSEEEDEDAEEEASDEHGELNSLNVLFVSQRLLEEFSGILTLCELLRGVLCGVSSRVRTSKTLTSYLLVIRTQTSASGLNSDRFPV